MPIRPNPVWVIKSVNEEKREVGGLLTAECLDKDSEVMSYDASKPHFQAWSDEAYKATTGAGQEPSYGNLRLQHSKQCVGKFNAPLVFDDQKKTIWGQAKIYDDDTWEAVKHGQYTGFSVGGNLVGPVKKINGKSHIAIAVREVSLVDNPACGVSHFDFVRAADGQVMKVAFQHKSKIEIAADALIDVFKAAEYSTQEIGQVLDHMKEHFGEELEEEQTGEEKGVDPALAPVPNPAQDGAKVAPLVEQKGAYAPDAIPDKHQPDAVQPTDQQVHMSADVVKTPPIEAQRPFGAVDTQLGKTSSDPAADMIGLDHKGGQMSAKAKPESQETIADELLEHGHVPTAAEEAAEKVAVEKHDRVEEPATTGTAVTPDPNIETTEVGHVLEDFGTTAPTSDQLDRKEKVSPPGWEDAIQSMKEDPDIDNPFALAWWMEDEGYEPKFAKAAIPELHKLYKVALAKEKTKLSKVSSGAFTMPTEVQKAARASLHTHLQSLKAAATKHKEAAAAHEADVHGLVDKCMKLAGGPGFEADSEHAQAEHETSGSELAATQTEVKAAKSEIEKLAGLVATLTASVEKLSKPEEKTEKAAKADDKVTGDASKAQPTGDPVEKLAAEKKEDEKTLELAKAAFGRKDVVQDGKVVRTEQVSADPKALNALYDKLTNAKAYRAAHPVAAR